MVVDDADGVDEGIARPSAGVIDHEVAGDAEHPSTETTERQIIPTLVVDFQKGLLGQILGERPIPEVLVEKSAEFRLILGHQFVEGGAAAILKADHEMIIRRPAGVEVHGLR